MRRAACWWCRAARRLWTRRVLVGIDPQAPDATLLAQAAALAAECALPLRVVCVATSDDRRSRPRRRPCEAAVQQALARGARAEGEVRTGQPHQQLVAAARELRRRPDRAGARHGGDRPGPRLDRRHRAEGHRPGRPARCWSTFTTPWMPPRMSDALNYLRQGPPRRHGPLLRLPQGLRHSISTRRRAT